MDWANLMRAGLLHLRLLPRDFWGLTPAELQLMLGLDAALLPMGSNRLQELAQQYPDTE